MSDNKLTKLDALFGEMKDVNKDEKDKAIQANVKSLVPFKNHPFRLYTGRRFDEMVRSIKEFGILQPIIVRSFMSDSVQFKDFNIETNKYEILAGHNRWNAAIAAELEEVPIVIMEGLSDEEAMLVVIETNLMQRSFADLIYSERALILSEHYNALKSQGRRTDIINQVRNLLNADEINDSDTSGHDVQKLDSRDKVGQEYGLDGRTIARYIKINTLCQGLKRFIDDEIISLTAGVELSYLSEDNQIYLTDILNNNKYKVKPEIASELRRLEESGKLNESTMESVLAGTYKKSKKTPSIFNGIKVKSNVLKKYFNEKQSTKEVEEIIDKALELYYQNQKEEGNES
jgi:ParB family transcriptional regulator, chromosome partitioning protein